MARRPTNLSSLLVLISFLKESRLHTDHLTYRRMVDTRPIAMSFPQDIVQMAVLIPSGVMVEGIEDLNWNIISFCGEIIAS
jgi:hypothetical protein